MYDRTRRVRIVSPILLYGVRGHGLRYSVGIIQICMYVCMYVCIYVYTYVHTCYVLIKPPIPYITSSPLCLLRGFAS